MKLSLLFAFGLTTAVLAGCGGAEVDTNVPSAPDPSTPNDTPASSTPFTVEWGSCEIPGRAGSIEVECATVDAPARRGIADSGTTPVAVYRMKSRKQPATAQLWMLNGGPGGAGFSLAPFAQMVGTFDQAIDVYMVDHRGTGASEFLECPVAVNTSRTMKEYAERCSKEIRKVYGARVDGFSTTESAADVRDLIASTATPEQKVFVYGGSYGSYWAHRFLQLPDVRVDAVVTDGNCISETCTFDTPQAFGVDEAMKFVLDVCKDTPECAAKLGADPWSFAVATVEKLKSGHCSQAKLATYAPSDVMHIMGVYWPAGIPPLLYRLDRCSPADVDALETLESNLQQIFGARLPSVIPDLGTLPKPTRENAYSQTLQLHVVASEMISRPAPSQASLIEKASTLVFAPNPESLDLSYADAWQGYPRDELVGKWVEKDVPWLMMQGTFDFQTVFSLSQRALERLKDPSLQFVRIDGGGHGVAFDSACSVGILESFLANPHAKVDTSCVPSLKTDALAIAPQYPQFFFGTDDAWE